MLIIRKFQIENIFCKSFNSIYKIDEFNILFCHNHPFMVKLHYAYQDNININFIMDYVPGGELFTHLSKRKKFSLEAVKFYAG
jgi:protein-serine/threonine kinase